MGPEKNEQKNDAVFQDLLLRLAHKHGIFTTPRELLLVPKMQEERDRVIGLLQEAVAEIVFQDACEGF